MTDYTFRTVPFRILTPALKMLPVIVTSVLSQVYTPTWEHRPLAAQIVALKEKTDALKNPTRNKAVVHLTAWYGAAIDLRAALPAEQVGLAMALDNVINELKWLERSWEFMKAKMTEQKAGQ